MVKLIGLDTSSSCSGYSVFVNGEYVNSGVIDLSYDKNGKSRLQNMCLRLCELLDTEQPDIIAVEMTVVSRNEAAQRTLTMILGVIYSWCILHKDVEFIMLRPTEWRALISKEKKGRKREELKQWSVLTVEKLFNKKVNDDESDAILIGQAYINKFDKEN